MSIYRSLSTAVAAMAMSSISHQEPEFYRAPKKPRPKSTHKRTHKGSKAAKRPMRIKK